MQRERMMGLTEIYSYYVTITYIPDSDWLKAYV